MIPTHLEELTMNCSTKTKIVDLILLGVFLLTGIVRLIRHYFIQISDNTILYILFVSVIFVWSRQMRKRLLHDEERKYLTSVSISIVFYLMIRTIKYVFLPVGALLTRYAWYLYYLPQTLIVLFLFFAILCIGKPYDYRIKNSWKFLYVLAAFLIISIMTNDIHQMAFRFPNGIKYWDEIPYIHGLIYYLAVFWMILFFFITLVITVIKCSILEKRKNIWIPLIPLLIGILYIIAFIIERENKWQMMWKTSEMMCFITIAFIECLIIAGLFPSNDNYEKLWNASTLRNGIMDKEGKICYQSKESIDVSLEQVQMALNEKVYLQDGNLVLRSHFIKGGYGYWIRDLSEINYLNKELEEIGDVLQEENAMLKAENELMQKKMRILQKNHLYNNIAKSVSKQLDEIEQILKIPQEEKEFEKNIKYVCILNTYIKRRSNLLLLLAQNQKIHSNELWLAIMESLEYVKVNGIYKGQNCHGERMLDGNLLLLTYQIFENILEASVKTCKSILVDLDVTDGIEMHMEIEPIKNLVKEDDLVKEVEKLQGHFLIEIEDEIGFVTLTFPKRNE